MRGPPDLQKISAALSPFFRDLHLLFSAQILAGHRALAFFNALDRPGVHDLSAVNARAGAHVHKVIGRPHGVLIVLYHNDGVAQVSQVLQGFQKLLVIPLVQADAGLVQDVQHPHQGRADLSGQTNALAFPAGKGAGGTGKGQIFQAHAVQEAQPGFDFLEDRSGNELFPVGKL